MQRIALLLAIGATLMLPARSPAAGANTGAGQAPGPLPAAPHTGAADRQSASALLVKCLRDTIPRLDDMRSDASTIAKGALGVCRPQIVAVFQATGAPDPQGMADQTPAQGTFEQIATAMTLERRVALSSRHHARSTHAGLGRTPAMHGGQGRGSHASVSRTSSLSLVGARASKAKPCQHYPYCS
jgi:hypothetical protein